MIRLRAMLSYPQTMGRLGRGTLLSTVGLVLRALVQGAYLILLSRWMGPEGYGLFSGIVAAGVVLAPLAGWGLPLLLTERVAKNPAHAAEYWRGALRRLLATGLILATLYVALMGTLLSASVGLMVLAMAASAELLLLPMAQSAAALCLGLGRAAAATAAVVVVPLGRLAALLLIPLLGLDATASTVILLHFLGTIVGALAALAVVLSVVGWRAGRTGRTVSDSPRHSAQYAVGAGMAVGYQELDKVLLLQLAGAAVTGQYTAAFRVASVFVLPIAALLGMALPRLFASYGTPSGGPLLRALLASSLAYGVCAGIGVIAIAPYLHLILGSEFSVSSAYLAILAPWPLLFALHQVAGAALTSAGRQGERIAIEGTVFAAAVATNCLLIPHLGGGSAVLTLLVAELLMALACATVWRMRRAVPSGGPADTSRNL